MKYRILTCIGLAALIAIPGKTSAVEGIGNLGDVFDQFPSIGDIQGVFPGMSFATTFRTGAGSYNLDAVTLEHLLGDPLALQKFRVQIYKEERLRPIRHYITLIGEVGNAVADPTLTQWPADTKYVKYTPLAPIVLEPNSHYWVAASEPADGEETAALLFSLHFGITGLCDWRLDESWVSDGFFDPETGEQFWNITHPMKFKVEATPVNGELPHCNSSPDVSAAHASISKLWPPNGKMVSVHIEGVTDIDGDPVTIGIYGIVQDEPVTTPQKDTTTPDGTGLGSDTAQLRAERLDSGNGRVYKIFYWATDGKPNSYSYGEVLVSVPHDLGAQATAIDDGRYYDSSGF